MEDPPCGWCLGGVAFLVRKCGPMGLKRLSLPKTLQSGRDQDAFNEGMQGVHPVPQRLPSRPALSGPIEMPAQAPYGQGPLAYGAERAA